MENRICKKCGLNKNAQRNPVILDNNILSYSSYLESLCPECSHVRDGSTISKEG